MDKIINVNRASMPPIDEYIDIIKPLWETHFITNNGVLNTQLQDEINAYLGAKNTLLFCNGHSALSCAIRVLDLTGEVITTPFTFASTTHAIVENGLTPVFCDIKPEDFTIDPNKIESLITEKTSAILGVHVYGNMCDTDAIHRIAKKHDLKVIYDAAHTFGVRKNGKTAACFGDISMFSFHATKVFNTIEGGCLTFNNEQLKEPLKRIMNFGILAGYTETIQFGINAKMNEFSAAMGLCNLRYIEQYINDRKSVYEKYCSLLSNITGIRVFEVTDDYSHNYAYMPVLFNRETLGINRNDVFDELKKFNINTRMYFYPLTSDFTCYKGRFISDTPIARGISENVLCLPIYSELSRDDVERICGIIIDLVNRV
jgi:dTDP-4-amino-4,6-dideoxygalactose transaminase